MAKDYIIEIKIKNGPMKRCMKIAGFETASELARASGLAPTQVGIYLNLKQPAIHKKTGEWTKSVKKMADAMKVLPEMMFPEQHYKNPLEKNSIEAEVGIEEIQFIIGEGLTRTLEETVDEGRKLDAIEEVMSSLLLRERQVLDMRFGMNGEEEHTLGDVADTLCVTPERVRQIESKALRKLRHPERAKPLREFIEK